MSNVTNTDPVVTESKLTEFYEDIKPFLGCPAYVTQEGDEQYYSTNEKVIGRWIDGKPIYQKTWTGLNYTIGTSWVSLSAIVSNGYCDRVLNGFGSRADGSLIPLVVYVPNGDVQVVAAQSSFGEVTEITLTYTKTTDSAVTTIEVKSTHYSTDEQVVGTWIDGKPLYQKTFAFRASNGWNTIDSSGDHSTWKMSMLKSIFVATSDGSFFGGNNSYGVLVNMPSSICNSSNFRVYCPSFSKNTVDSYITVQYTKSSD